MFKKVSLWFRPGFEYLETTISGVELRAKCEDVFGKKSSIFIRGGIYKLITLETLAGFLNRDIIDKYHYDEDYFSCVDFSIVLWSRVIENIKNIPFGMVWYETDKGILHSRNCWLNPGLGRVQLIEPQDDNIQDFPAGAKAIFVVM